MVAKEEERKEVTAEEFVSRLFSNICKVKEELKEKQLLPQSNTAAWFLCPYVQTLPRPAPSSVSSVPGWTGS